ncbi:unnamed protein product [Coregonus sp. 'balchen']|nr:unnamed protein product [Coregonus sp. 'balchen']
MSSNCARFLRWPSDEMQEFLALNTDTSTAFEKKMFVMSRIDKVFLDLSLSGLECFLKDQEALLYAPRRWEADEWRFRVLPNKDKKGDTAVADVPLNILCLLMKDQWSWLCTENIQKTIRLLFGTFVER